MLAVVGDRELVALPDDQLLAAATEQGRCLVTLNVHDFASLDASWRGQGRTHPGIVCVPSSAFPRNRGFLGRLVTALGDLLAHEQVPGRGELTFLHSGL